MTDRTHGLKVGDLCVLLHSERGIHLGAQCELIEGPINPEHYPTETGFYIKILASRSEHPSGMYFAPTEWLKRIDPPSDQYIRQETTDWSKCAWQPQRTEA